MIIRAFFNGAQQRLGPRPGLVRGEAAMVANRRSSRGMISLASAWSGYMPTMRFHRDRDAPMRRVVERR